MVTWCKWSLLVRSTYQLDFHKEALAVAIGHRRNTIQSWIPNSRSNEDSGRLHRNWLAMPLVHQARHAPFCVDARLLYRNAFATMREIARAEPIEGL